MNAFNVLLLDYRFWGRSSAAVQLSVIECVGDSMKMDVKAFSKIVGISRLIEWIRFVHNDCFSVKSQDCPT